LNKKIVALLVVFVAVLIGLIYSIENTARPPSERAGTVASGGESPAPGPGMPGMPGAPGTPPGPGAPAGAPNAPAGGDPHAGHNHPPGQGH
jgi:hypothetical protein